MLRTIFTIVTVMLTTLVYAGTDASTYIPSQAFKYRATIWSELDKYFPVIPTYYYVPSLVEHESCISLKHKRCWEPTSQLKSQREEGAGLSQITKAFNADGSIRFDSLQEIKDNYKAELKDLSWSNVYTRPDLQIRAMVLMLKTAYGKLYDVTNPMERLKMTDAAYNGGLGGLNKERRACSLSSTCNPQVWFGNVEKIAIKSQKAIYGTRSPLSINRHHVVDTILVKLPKYTTYYH